MKNSTTYHFYFLLLALVLLSCGRKDKELPSLKETFSKNDENPFGTYVAHRELSQLFYNNELRIKKVKLSTGLKDNFDTASLYISISKNFFLTRDDLEMMLNYVKSGNSMFISSENMDTAFLNTVGLVQNKIGSSFTDFFSQLKYTAVKLQPAVYNDSSLFRYYYLPLNNFFTTGTGNTMTKVLGTNEDGSTNFLVLFYGKGRFYLHGEPRVFSNYFLLQKNNFRYLQQSFSLSPAVPERIFWDDYYNKRNSPPSAKADKTGIAVLLQYPAMAWAYWLAVGLLLSYLFFGSKRRQRIIKPEVPNANTTVAFTETVGRLYLQNKDNRDMADKMITYFLEHIRNQYFLNTNNFTGEFIGTLSRKANVPLQDTERLIDLICTVQQSAEIDDRQLLLLNRQIEKFYKHKK